MPAARMAAMSRPTSPTTRMLFFAIFLKGVPGKIERFLIWLGPELSWRLPFSRESCPCGRLDVREA